MIESLGVAYHIQVDSGDALVLHKLSGSHYDWLLQIGNNYIYLTSDKLRQLGLALNGNANDANGQTGSAGGRANGSH